MEDLCVCVVIGLLKLTSGVLVLLVPMGIGEQGGGMTEEATAAAAVECSTTSMEVIEKKEGQEISGEPAVLPQTWPQRLLTHTA